MGSLKYIPIGVASALQNISPIITFFIQRFYHKKVIYISM
jgi:drug/metabolite transporter (DMT)-like permease